jgi:hypothetical protein
VVGRKRKSERVIAVAHLEVAMFSSSRTNSSWPSPFRSPAPNARSCWGNCTGQPTCGLPPCSSPAFG